MVSTESGPEELGILIVVPAREINRSFYTIATQAYLPVIDRLEFGQKQVA